MRKYRSWLMGLGIGLIVGASMLQLILAAKDQAGNKSGMPLTRAQLEEEASKAGFVVYSANEKVYTEDELQAKLDEAKKATEQPAATPTASQEAPSTDNANTTQQQDQTGTKAPEATPSASPSAPPAEDPVAVTLYVRPGMNLTEVANKLEELGVVEDAKDFIDKCWSISKDLEVGTAVFTGKPTYRDIMTELTRRKP
ncbi:hypothetical protein [Cohnella yongneupensis]|uniref:YceG-like family protein n=1 Tax=Cohnella yongneupensis TaxID=425006 RepID=A0ABW0R5G8_9BACL